MANRLRRQLDTRHEVILVNREPVFSFAASYLWVMTGQRTPRQVTRPLGRLERRGIQVLIGEVTSIDPATRGVLVGSRELTADHLMITVGADQLSMAEGSVMTPPPRRDSRRRERYGWRTPADAYAQHVRVSGPTVARTD